uniref:CUE domain-containing protein n=1 Tax=Glossina brevipalpis TaxID=37001 RepID=A0A1A9X169_9MUSC
MPVKNPFEKPIKGLNLIVVDKYGTKRIVPALDAFWARRSVFARFSNLLVGRQVIQGVALDEWRYEAEQVKDDLDFLLCQAHHEFWSYMIYQKAALASISSILQNCVPFYANILDVNISVGMKKLHDDILYLAICVISRILTLKESPECWMENDHFRELVYDNYVISAAMLFDLLIAVGNASSGNVDLLRKVFGTLLRLEPRFREDIQTAIKYLKTAFRSIHTQTENEGFDGAGGGLVDNMSDTPFDDVALYALNCSFTLSVLLDVCPDARSICEEQKLTLHISKFYDVTLRQLYINIYNVNPHALSLIWVNQARIQFLRAFRSIIWINMEAILTDPRSSALPSENFIAALTECLADQAFVNDYQRQYPIALDVDIIKQACKKLDRFRIDFLIGGYQNGTNRKTFQSNQKVIAEKPKSVGQISNVKYEERKSILNGATNANLMNGFVKQRDIQSEVVTVSECFPNLGTGFIRHLLNRYDNTEEVITALLENNLPPDMLKLKRSDVYIPPDPLDKFGEATGVKHCNIFDGDEYDVMTQDNPKCIIKKGKGFPNAPKNARQLLDDKTDIALLKDRYQGYSLVTEDNSNGEREYDDEYDDSCELMLENENLANKSKHLRDVSANAADESTEESEARDSQEHAKTNEFEWKKKYKNVRDLYEGEAKSKSFRKSDFRKSPAHKDVVGGPKGKGQDKEVWRNRQKKEAQKSSRANHNRKARAAFKRSAGGMN